MPTSSGASSGGDRYSPLQERYDPNCVYCQGTGMYRVEVPDYVLEHCVNLGAHCTAAGHTSYCNGVARRFGSTLCPCSACNGTLFVGRWYIRVEERECDCKGFY
ncbi:unnamed protein product [Fusarium graminearum]|nr:unnamed protein product [Fusarium graminearum]